MQTIDKVRFDKVSTHPLQSWAWGQFRQAWGNEVRRFSFGQITLHKIPFTPYKIGMFIRGPLPDQKMLTELMSFAKQNKVIFIKLEPNVLKNKKTVELLRKNGAVRGKTLFTPTSFRIDLTKSEEELLASFHPKTRYNIRLAQKNGVEGKIDDSEEAFKKYIALTRETVRRQGFYAHSEKYHRLMWEHLNKEGIAHLLVARYKGEIVTTWIVFVWKDFLYYPYGASTDKHKNIMANNLMMWEAIRFGKKMGLMVFDLWGREEGKGFTKFKEGYNPKVVEFLGTWDLIARSFLYRIYRVSETLRWLFLRLLAKLGLSKAGF